MQSGKFTLLKRLLKAAIRKPASFLSRQKLADEVNRQLIDDSQSFAPGINLIGHPYAVLGRAEDIRTGARACADAQLPFCLINRNGDWDAHLQDMHKDFPHFGLVRQSPEYCVNLYYLNADEMPSAWEAYGDSLFAGRYNIGCFAWELSIFPEAWKPSFEHLQEIWAPTEFIRESIVKVTDTPVVHMPFVVEPGEPGNLGKKDFSLPDDKFLFLFFFDFRSYVSRKNPHAVLEAFFQAFPDDAEDVHLVIKVNGTEQKREEFAAFLQDKRFSNERLSIIEQSLDDKGIKSLVSLCDCFVSLHRSEGFGRGLAEAMYYGKPVIATGYSGNMDFMSSDTSCLVDYELISLQENDYPYWQGQVWADADVSQAAKYMRQLFEDQSYARALGEKAREYILTHHSTKAVGMKQRARLEALGLVRPL